MTKPDDSTFPHITPVIASHLSGVGEKIGEQYHSGLTKREYFAGLAMQGFCNASPFDYSSGPHNSAIAERAVVIADALIAELSKGTEGER